MGAERVALVTGGPRGEGPSSLPSRLAAPGSPALRQDAQAGGLLGPDLEGDTRGRAPPMCTCHLPETRCGRGRSGHQPTPAAERPPLRDLGRCRPSGAQPGGVSGGPSPPRPGTWVWAPREAPRMGPSGLTLSPGRGGALAEVLNFPGTRMDVHTAIPAPSPRFPLRLKSDRDAHDSSTEGFMPGALGYVASS